jgi:hypothetical protein
MKIKVVVLVLACSGWSSAWAANKCVGADGSVVFQDAACPNATQSPGKAATQAMAQPKNVMSSAEVARSLNAQMEQPENRQRAQAALDRREAHRKSIEDSIRSDRVTCGPGAVLAQPVVGMAESNFLACTRFAREWSYSKINETETAYGVRRQYVYGVSAPIRYVYTNQGQVVSITR